MDGIYSSGFDYLGKVNDDGYVFDQADHCFAKISDSGYITEVGGGKVYGKIDQDGTIRDPSLNVVGRIQANGYVWLHGKWLYAVSSKFIKKITPLAWNAGEPSTYNGRKQAYSKSSSDAHSSGGSTFLITTLGLIIIGIIFGIILWINGIGGIQNIIAGPVVVFFFFLCFKLFG